MSLSRAGVVAGLDLTTEAALTKLAYLLGLPDATPESVARDMSKSLRGELTEVSQPVFRHPDGALTERVQALTILGYAIAQGDLTRVEEILKLENHYLLNDADYSGNTPMVRCPFFIHLPRFRYLSVNQKLQHLAATSPSLSILRFLLMQGGSVHIRNRNNRTPLFLAANAGLSEHVMLLRKSGAHLHSDERTAAQLLARRRPGVWGLAGIGPREVSDREMEEVGEERLAERVMAGSAP